MEGMAVAPNLLTSCTVIDTPGNYTLNRNIHENDATICIDIRVEDYGIVEFDDAITSSMESISPEYRNRFSEERDGRHVIRDLKMTDWHWGISNRGNYERDSLVERCDIGFTSPWGLPVSDRAEDHAREPSMIVA